LATGIGVLRGRRPGSRKEKGGCDRARKKKRKDGKERGKGLQCYSLEEGRSEGKNLRYNLPTPRVNSGCQREEESFFLPSCKSSKEPARWKKGRKSSHSSAREDGSLSSFITGGRELARKSFLVQAERELGNAKSCSRGAEKYIFDPKKKREKLEKRRPPTRQGNWHTSPINRLSGRENGKETGVA